MKKEKIMKIEKLIQKDIGNRGISKFLTNDLYNSCEEILKSNSIAIITGFAVPPDFLTETDGPLGCLCMIETLLQLKKNIILITDDKNEEILNESLKIMNIDIPLIIFPSPKFYNKEKFNNQSYEDYNNDLTTKIFEKYELDHIISIERLGPNKNGSYCSKLLYKFNYFK
jgi:hypothetical protein